MDNFINSDYKYSPDVISEKKSIFADASKLGCLLILYEILQNFFSKAYYYAAYFIFAKKFSLDWKVVTDYLLGRPKLIASTSFRMTLCISVTFFCVAIVALVSRFIFKVGAKGYLKPGRGSIKEGLKWFPGCYLANLIFTLICSYVLLFLSAGGVAVPEADFTITSPSIGAVTVQFAYTVIMAPIVEEYIYRGIILGTLAKYNKGAAVMLSALAFALMHGNIPQAASAFATGLLYAVIAVNCGSIVPTIIIHILNNVIAGASDFADVLKIPYFEVISSIVLILLAILGLLVFCTRYKELKLEKNTSGTLSSKESKKYIFLNPAILFYLGLLIYYIIKSLISANI